MLCKGMMFNCNDNTGVKKVKCFYVYGPKKILPGSVLLVSVRKVVPSSKIKKGQIYKAVVVQLRKDISRWTGVKVKYNNNAIVLLKKNDMIPLGTRVFGSVFFELRLRGFMKIVFLSSYVL